MDLPGSGPLWDPPSLNHRPHPRKGSSFRRLKCSQTSFLTVTAGLLQKKTSRGGRRCWLHGVGELWESSAERRFVIKVIANRFWQFWRFWESSWIQWWKNPNWTAWQIKTRDQDLGHWWHEVSINLKTNVINRQICKCDRNSLETCETATTCEDTWALVNRGEPALGSFILSSCFLTLLQCPDYFVRLNLIWGTTGPLRLH